MLLSRTAEYALRAMACLAVMPDEPLSSDAIADLASIPPHYVSKVMRQLVVAGLVTGRRGRAGGFELARAPRDIRFAEVLDAVRGLPDADRCAFGNDRCNPSAPCPLHPTWERLQEAFRAWAVETTLAQVGLGEP